MMKNIILKKDLKIMIKKIISDSGANVLHLDDASFENIPLTIHVDGTDYQDDASLSVNELIEALHP